MAKRNQSNARNSSVRINNGQTLVELLSRPAPAPLTGDPSDTLSARLQKKLDEAAKKKQDLLINATAGVFDSEMDRRFNFADGKAAAKSMLKSLKTAGKAALKMEMLGLGNFEDMAEEILTQGEQFVDRKIDAQSERGKLAIYDEEQAKLPAADDEDDDEDFSNI